MPYALDNMQSCTGNTPNRLDKQRGWNPYIPGAEVEMPLAVGAPVGNIGGID